MSDFVHCDKCDKIGKRPRFYPAPKDWFFIESKVEEETVFTYTCSIECRDNIWKTGPGDSFKQEAFNNPQIDQW